MLRDEGFDEKNLAETICLALPPKSAVPVPYDVIDVLAAGRKISAAEGMYAYVMRAATRSAKLCYDLRKLRAKGFVAGSRADAAIN